MAMRIFARRVTTWVGLTRSENPRQDLIGLYKQTLDELKTFPDEAGYKQLMQAITLQRLKIVEEGPDVATVEQKLDCGAIDEVIDATRDELELIPKMREWKPWENTPDEDAPSKL